MVDVDPIIVPRPDGRFEAGAEILSALYRPDTPRSQRRLQTNAFCAYLQAYTGAARHLPLKEREEWQLILKAEGKLRNRMGAAEMVLPALARLMEGVVAEHDWPLVGEAAERLSVRMDMGGASNVKARVWRPSAPVLHLCAAYWVLVVRARAIADGTLDPERNVSLRELVELGTWETGEAEIEESRRFGIEQTFGDPAFVEELVAQSEIFAPLLPRTKMIRANEALIRFAFEDEPT
jgi:hypothetical protein